MSALSTPISARDTGAGVPQPSSPSESRWRGLYTSAGVAALIMALFIPVQVVVFLIWPPPLGGSAQEWFALLQANRLIGLLSLDLLLMIGYGLIVFTVLALYVALRDVNPSAMLIAVVFNLMALGIYFASNPAVEMMTLSSRYAAAADDAQRTIYLVAGESLMATYTGTAFHASYIVASLAGIVIAWVMLHSPGFSKLTAIMGILGNVVGLGLYVPVIGVWLSLFSVLFFEVWFILLGRRLLQMGATNLHNSFKSP